MADCQSLYSIAIALQNGPEVVESDYDRRFVRAAICDRAWRVTQLQAMFDELRQPKARLNRDKTIRTQSYEAAAAMLKQAAQELGQWEEAYRGVPDDRGPDLSALTTEQLLEEQRILAEARQRLEAIRIPKEPGLIEAAPGAWRKFETMGRRANRSESRCPAGL